MVEYSKEEIAEHYDDFDELYENWSGSASGGYHYGIVKNISDIFHNDKMVHNLSEYIINSLGVAGDGHGTVLFDAGCGAGDVATMVSKRYERVVVYGMTLSKQQYKIAQKKHSLTQRLQILQGDFENTGLNEKMFDIIYFIDSICHGTGNSKELALKEVNRLLKPGGKLVVCDVFLQKSKSQRSKWFELINKQVKNVWRVNTWSVEELFVQKAERLGFVQREVINLTWKIVPSVLHMIFTKIPFVCMQIVKNREYIDGLRAFVQLSIFAPLLGMHPTFQYKLMILEKLQKK
jgi:ubiquinone/menaquinone biosynthesis C-methylase UbiE